MRHLWVTIATITLILSILFYQQLTQVVLIAGYVLAGLLIAFGSLVLVYVVLRLRLRLRLLKADVIEAEKQAHVLTISDNGETWVRDTDAKAAWRNLTGSPSLCVNGQQAMPQDWEIELHRLKLTAMAQTSAGAKVIPGDAQLLPAPKPLDLLQVFTQPTQSYAIIGGQQTGKTFQARHIAAYWVRQGIKPVVIGPKWDKGEWSGCYLIGGNGAFESVGQGITLVRKLVEQRHANTTKWHKEHTIQPIFFDDWTPIVDTVPNARALVLEATTLYASVNVLLYFILHSDTANAWGVDRKGAALKDNFIKLLIVPQYDDNGLIIRSQTKGVIKFAGDNNERPAQLFTMPPVMAGKSVLIPLKKRNTPQEVRIKDLHKQGHTKAEICRRVFGNVGGKQYQAIDAVLSQQTRL